MIEFALFCIATVGMTSIIVQGVLFQPLRQYMGGLAERSRLRREQAAKGRRRTLMEDLSELLNCAQCVGFWCGLLCGVFLVSTGCLTTTGISRFMMWLCCGFGGSFLSAFGCHALDWIFYRKMNALRQLEEQDLILAERRGAVEDSAL